MQVQQDFPEGFDAVVGWSDNGPHFHNSIFLGRVMSQLRTAFDLPDVEWNFFEPGEAKNECDQHFSQVGGAFRRHIRSGKVIDGADDVMAVVHQKMANTYVAFNEIDRSADEAAYFSVTAIKSYKQFINSGEHADGFLRARVLTGLGDWQVLSRGQVVRRNVHGDEYGDAVLLQQVLSNHHLSHNAPLLVQRGKLATDAKPFRDRDDEKAVAQALQRLVDQYPEHVRMAVVGSSRAVKAVPLG